MNRVEAQEYLMAGRGEHWVSHHRWFEGYCVTLDKDGFVRDSTNKIARNATPWHYEAPDDDYIAVEPEPEKPKWKDYELVKYRRLSDAHYAWYIREPQHDPEDGDVGCVLLPIHLFLDRADIKRIGYVFKLPNGEEVVRASDRVYMGPGDARYCYWHEGYETLEPVAIRVEVSEGQSEELRMNRPSKKDVLKNLRAAVDYAYANGFHECGFDLVDEFRRIEGDERQ